MVPAGKEVRFRRPEDPPMLLARAHVPYPVADSPPLHNHEPGHGLPATTPIDATATTERM
jgi:hypothetical protein